MTDLVEAPSVGRTPVADVADRLITLVRSFNRQRNRVLAAARHDVEWSTHIALKFLQNEGPMRAGTLAECLQSDPSTVSRQVAAMARDGLLERRADPEDGRASLLVLTEHAHTVLAEHDRIRLDFFAEILGDWSADDLRTFHDLLARFTAGYDEYANSTKMADRFGAALRPGGNR